MLRISLLIFTIFLCISFNGIAQTFPSDLWHSGRVVLMEGDSIRGKLKYDLDNNAVQIMEGSDGVKTYSALQVKFFELYDEIYGDFRYFYSIPYMTADGYERPIFFEVLFEGELSLLAREYIITEAALMNNSWFSRGAFGWPYERLAFHFYFVDARTGEVTEYNRKRKSLLNIMDNHSSNVRDYIKGNKLKIDQRSDLVKITSYYNGLNF